MVRLDGLLVLVIGHYTSRACPPPGSHPDLQRAPAAAAPAEAAHTARGPPACGSRRWPRAPSGTKSSEPTQPEPKTRAHRTARSPAHSPSTSPDTLNCSSGSCLGTTSSSALFCTHSARPKTLFRGIELGVALQQHAVLEALRRLAGATCACSRRTPARWPNRRHGRCVWCTGWTR